MTNRTTDLNEFPCPDKSCRCRTCSHNLIVEPDHPFEDESGECWVSAFCYYLQPPEEFKIRTEEYERYEIEKYTKSTGETAPTNAVGMARPKRGGVSAYAGETVAGFTVDQESTRVMVKGRTFVISHNADKNLIDQVISAVQNCQQGFCIRISPREYNALSPDGKCFAALFVVREMRKGKGNKKYTGLARLK